MGTWLARFALTVAVAAYAGLALASGLDRLADGDPAIPAPVDWAYADNGALNAATAAWQHHRARDATDLMARALLADPASEAMIGAMGVARLQTGDRAGADAAFRLSATRGWRYKPTHAYWLDKSLEFADFDAAALHADALLRQQIDDHTFDTVINAMLEYSEGRTALARRLAQRPPWAATFADRIQQTSDEALVGRADVVIQAGANTLSCAEVAGMIDRLIEIGASQEATGVYRKDCDASTSLIHDSHFARYLQHKPTSHFDWYTSEQHQVVIDSRAPAGAAFSSMEGITLPMIAQKIAAGPGHYRLTWTMPDTDPSLAGKVVADLSCSPDLGHALPGQAAQGNASYSADFTLDKACQLPVLAFWLRPTKTAINVDDVRLQKIGPQ